jgi:hypothetical protein
MSAVVAAIPTPTPKILTITIDEDDATPLNITYRIDANNPIPTQLTGISAKDTGIINEIFSNFLKSSKLMSKYNATVSNLKPLDAAIRYNEFSAFAKALDDLTEPERISFNKKALEAVFAYIKSTKRPAFREKSYFTAAAIELVDKQNGLSTSEKLFGANSSTIIAKIMETISNDEDDEDIYTNSNFLSRYLNVKHWVSQFYAWLKEFKSEPTNALSTPVFYKNNDLRIGGKKTQKNKKVYSDE